MRKTKCRQIFEVFLKMNRVFATNSDFLISTQSRRFYKVQMDKAISSIVIKIFVKIKIKKNEMLNKNTLISWCTQCSRPLIFVTMYYVGSSLLYQRSKPSGIRKFEFVAKTQFLYKSESPFKS